MRRFVVALLSAAAMGAVSASATELPVKAPIVKAPPSVAPYNWTGFYVGGHAGIAAGKFDWSFPGTTSAPINHNFSKFAGGAQLGFNYQINWLVLGIEGSGTFGNMNSESACPNAAVTCRSEMGWIAAATGRVGYARDNVLFYAKGGAAWTHQDYHGIWATAPAFNESASSNRTGWTAGGGIEWAFMKDWSASIEYDYYDFGTRRENFTRDTTGVYVESVDIKSYVQTVMLSLNYHFNGWFW